MVKGEDDVRFTIYDLRFKFRIYDLRFTNYMMDGDGRGWTERDGVRGLYNAEGFGYNQSKMDRTAYSLGGKR